MDNELIIIWDKWHFHHSSGLQAAEYVSVSIFCWICLIAHAIEKESCGIQELLLPITVISEFENTDSAMQNEDFPVSSVTAMHLRFSVKSGHDHFISVHKVKVDGNAVHN